MPNDKFEMNCLKCGSVACDLFSWYNQGQKCSSCGSKFVNVRLDVQKKDLLHAVQIQNNRDGIWRYFDLLPLISRKNAISAGESEVKVERWRFLEKYAQNYNKRIEVFAHRHDNQPATGTFKDLAGAVVASVLKELGIKSYVVSTTGNIGVALSRYLAEANIALHVFIPENSSALHDAEIGCFGQKVFRIKGDYARAKSMSEDFAQKNKMPISPSVYDPVRVQAKKTMAYEWFRQLDKFPSVYIQALSGGTGPLGVATGCQEIKKLGLIDSIPRMLLVQTDRCAPMSQAWAAAKQKGFAPGWNEQYGIVENPCTNIPTLATGNPKLYPMVAKLVKDTNGEIISFPEAFAPVIARLIAFEVAVRMGPAATIAVGGFFKALKSGFLRDGDRVLLGIGEGIRRSPDFMRELVDSPKTYANIEECSILNRDYEKLILWKDIENMMNRLI